MIPSLCAHGPGSQDGEAVLGVQYIAKDVPARQVRSRGMGHVWVHLPVALFVSDGLRAIVLAVIGTQTE